MDIGPEIEVITVTPEPLPDLVPVPEEAPASPVREPVLVPA